MAVKLNRSKIAGTVGTLVLLMASNAWAQGDQPQPPPTPPPTGTDTPTTPPPTAGDDKGKTDAPADQDKDKLKKKNAAEGDQTTPPTGPAAGSGASTSPGGVTVSLGTTPTKDTTTEGEDAKKKEEDQKLFWADTTLYAQTSFSTTTIAPQQQLTQASTVESWFLFQPRIAINKNWQIRGRATLSYEWTDTANTSTTTRNEPMFGDTILSLYYRGIPEIPKVGIKTAVGLNAGLPTSKLSWARTMIVTPGLTVALSKTFEKVLGGTVNLMASGTISHPFYQYTTAGPLSGTPYSFAVAPFAGGQSADSAAAIAGFGAANPENVLSFIFLASAEWELPKKWGTITPMAVMFWTNSWKYQFSDIPVGSVTGTNTAGNVPRLQDHTNFQQSTYFNLALEWSPTKWLGVEAGYYMFRNLISDDGKLHNPFFDDMQDMRLYLAANFTLDQLYLAIAGKRGGQEDVRPPGSTPGPGSTKGARRLNPFPSIQIH